MPTWKKQGDYHRYSNGSVSRHSVKGQSLWVSSHAGHMKFFDRLRDAKDWIEARVKESAA
jgi:hypothetical protein